MMTPTQILTKEHQAIKLMLDILEQIAGRLKAGGKVPDSDLKAILEFLQFFAYRCHHVKEEDLLFPAIEKAGMPREGGPIEVMLTEHNEGRGYIKGLAEAIDKKDKAGVVQNVRSYIDILRQHIDKEDTILYPIADMHIQTAKQKELLDAFDKIELERIGPGKHEEFHKLLKKLERTYL